MATPYVTIVQNVVSSTQDLAAARLAESGRITLVVAQEQTAGRGRSGNPWWQADRAVAASLALSTDHMPIDQTLPLAVGLAVRDAIASILGIEVGLKWPNDLVRNGTKVGGILVETDADAVVIGCGLNLFWSNPRPGVAGLCDSDPGPDLGLRLSRTWAEVVLSDGFDWNQQRYTDACETIGSSIEWEPSGSGRAVGIADNGGLVVATGHERVTLLSGEVREIRRVSDDA